MISASHAMDKAFLTGNKSWLHTLKKDAAGGVCLEYTAGPTITLLYYSDDNLKSLLDYCFVHR